MNILTSIIRLCATPNGKSIGIVTELQNDYRCSCERSQEQIHLEFEMPMYAILIFCSILANGPSQLGMMGQKWFVQDGVVCDEKGGQVAVYGVDSLGTVRR